MKTPSTLLRPVCALALAGLLLAGCAGLPGFKTPEPTAAPVPVAQPSGTVIAEGHVVPRDEAGLVFFVPGTVGEVLVKEGDTVQKGAVLARLSDRETYQAAVTAAELEQASAQKALDDLQQKAPLATGQALADLRQAEHDLIAAQQRLADLNTDDYQQRIDDATDWRNTTQDNLETAQEDFDRVKSMDKDNPSRVYAEDVLTQAQREDDQAVRDHDRLVNDRDAAQAAVDLAKARLDDATRTYNQRKDGPDPADLGLAQKRLANAGAQLAAAQAALAHLELTAPFAGTVARLAVAPGDQVSPTTPALVIADLSQWYVETSDLTEKDVVAIEEGQKVAIDADAFPDARLSGTVERIGRTFVERSGDITYVVRIALPETSVPLRWGMTVSATFKP